MTDSLTVVLPVRNVESTLNQHVNDALEMAGELTDGFQILIVDDGSTDDTFDTAVELSRQFPQVRVMRNAHQRGMGPTLRSVRSKVKSNVVVVHDGVSPIDTNEIRRLWIAHQHQATIAAKADPLTASIKDLREASTAHRLMAEAHSQLLGFQLLSNMEDIAAEPKRREQQKRRGVGAIPPLPKPNLLGSLTNFALGE